jgi:DnaJ-class molecular chaperone
MVKARYRDLARRFHPDRHSGDPGDTSRFLEIQTCFDAWRPRADG